MNVLGRHLHIVIDIVIANGCSSDVASALDNGHVLAHFGTRGEIFLQLNLTKCRACLN